MARVLNFLERKLQSRFLSVAQMSLSTLSGPTAQSIRAKLQEHFQPTHLQVLNESHMHNVPANSETHFKVVVISSQFEGLSPIARHRQVNAVLDAELKSGVHALSIVCKTPEAWNSMGLQGKVIPPSPKCRGGDGSLPSKQNSNDDHKR